MKLLLAIIPFLASTAAAAALPEAFALPEAETCGRPICNGALLQGSAACKISCQSGGCQRFHCPGPSLFVSSRSSCLTLPHPRPYPVGLSLRDDVAGGCCADSCSFFALNVGGLRCWTEALRDGLMGFMASWLAGWLAGWVLLMRRVS